MVKRDTDSVAATMGTLATTDDESLYQPLEPIYEQIGDHSQVETTEFCGDDNHLYEDINHEKVNSIGEDSDVVHDDYDDVVVQDYTNLKTKWMSS